MPKRKKIADRLIQVRKDLTRIYRTKKELQKLHENLVKQTNRIETAINDHNEGLLSKLEQDVDALYKKIQGIPQDEPSLVRLQLAKRNRSEPTTSQPCNGLLGEQEECRSERLP